MKKENLLRHVEDLCKFLNDHDYLYEARGERHLWNVDSRFPEATFGGGICSSEAAFLFLKKSNKINIGVCWHCGEEPITDKFSFTDGFNENIKFPICKSCYGIGSGIEEYINQFK